MFLTWNHRCKHCKLQECCIYIQISSWTIFQFNVCKVIAAGFKLQAKKDYEFGFNEWISKCEHYYIFITWILNLDF